MSERTKSNWEALANATVEQAAKDYLQALKVLKGWSRAVLRGKQFNPGQKERMRSHILRVTECEYFFENYCGLWTNIDGRYIRDKLLAASGMDKELLNELLKNYLKEDMES